MDDENPEDESREIGEPEKSDSLDNAVTTQALRRAILQRFAEVEGTRYVPHCPDDWRKARPDSFNCSSFVQWLALRVLGWSEEEKTKHDPPNVRALLAFPKVTEQELRTGDILVYTDMNDESDLHAMVYIDHDEVIGACEDGGGVIQRPAEYAQRWKLRFARRITLA
jgi:hypothetical protein